MAEVRLLSGVRGAIGAMNCASVVFFSGEPVFQDASQQFTVRLSRALCAAEREMAHVVSWQSFALSRSPEYRDSTRFSPC